MERAKLRPPPQAKRAAKPRSALLARVQDEFLKLAAEGQPLDAICDYLGVAHATFYSWIRKGDSYLSSGDTPPEDAEFGEFTRKLRRATAQYRFALVRSLHKDGTKGWFRDLTILERRDRRNFGRYEPMGGGAEEYDPDDKFL